MTTLLSDGADVALVGAETSIYVYAQEANDPAINFAALTQTDGTFLVSREKLDSFEWIGMGTTILDGAEIGEGAFIGAGSLVPPGKKIPPNTLAFGRPAKVVRAINEKDRQEMERIVKDYRNKG